MDRRGSQGGTGIPKCKARGYAGKILDCASSGHVPLEGHISFVSELTNYRYDFVKKPERCRCRASSGYWLKCGSDRDENVIAYPCNRRQGLHVMTG